VNLSETLDVLAAIGSLQERGRGMALATIVDVRGSTYRRPGARLLVPDAGDVVGNLSGGCLEGEVTDVAREIMAGGSPRLELYDLTADDEVVWGWGLGCNGAIEVFVEPADRAAEMAAALREAIENERSVAVVTVLRSTIPAVDTGARLLLYPGDERRGSVGRTDVDAAVLSALSTVIERGDTGTHELSIDAGDVRVFLECLEPPLRLLVCGAGHDAIPVVTTALGLGWSVTVADDRPAMLSSERFGSGARFVNCSPGAVHTASAVDDRTYAVVMSHNYLRDRDYLRALLGSPAPYIGMLGPQARTERLLDDLAGDGIVATADDRERIHGPAGLDLGAEGPEEIATAIAGEVLAVSRGRAGGFLRERSGSIHDRRAVAAS
jgi:xanthine/CO dehydrogenase XdhC/CoxF family maturation factor